MKLFTPTSERARARTRDPRWQAMQLPKNPPAEPRRGVALVMVLVLTTILGALAADLQNATSVNLQLAANARDQLQAYFHARSAVELELFFLRFQSQLKGVLGNFIPIPLFEMSQYFVSSDTMKGIVDRKAKTPTSDAPRKSLSKDRQRAPQNDDGEDFGLSDKPFGDFEGSFWIEEVVDENRKININKPSSTTQNPMHLLLAGLFADPKYDKLFENLGQGHDPIRNRLEIISNITDWVDGNDTIDPVAAITNDLNSGGSEDSRYSHLPYGAVYKPKNGQMNSLAELRMVPGVTDDFMRIFSPSLTVWTDDNGVNVNTADPQMMYTIVRALCPLPPPSPADVEKFEKFTQLVDIKRAMPPPLNKIASMAELVKMLSDPTVGFKVDPARQQQIDSGQLLRFDDNSSVYRVTAVGRVGEATSTITLVWRDDRSTGEIRYWREE